MDYVDFENKRGVRNQSFLRGSKAVADKCDTGMITMWLGEEEMNIISQVVNKLGCKMPNYVTDVYKGRRTKYKNVKIWSVVDLGVCKREDILITDGFYNPIEGFVVNKYDDCIFKNIEASEIDVLLNKKVNFSF